MTGERNDKIDPEVLKSALILIVGGLAVVFDTTIVSVALHTLAAGLHTTVSTIQWVRTGYLLALGIAMPLVSWALQRFGGKRLWMFALPSSSPARSAPAWRGTPGAHRLPCRPGGRRRRDAAGAHNADHAGGRRQGARPDRHGRRAARRARPDPRPVIGGAILTHLSWRFMFWVNVPFCVAGLVLAARFMAADAPSSGPQTTKPRLDVPGLILLTPAVSAVILGLTNAGRAAGFAHPDVIVPILAGAALLAAFTFYALRRARPLVDIRLLARRPVASASAVLFFSGFALYGAMLLLPLYYQEVRGASALAAGIMLVPQGIGTLLSRSAAGRLTDRIGARPVAVGGFVIVALATVPFTVAGAHANTWLLALSLVVRGFGLGAVTIPVMAVAYLGLDRQQIAHSSVLTRTTQQIGGSFGTAVLAVILEGAVTGHGGNLPAAFGIAFWWSVGFSLLAVLLSCWLPGAQHDQARPETAETRPVSGARR